jgi:hypothetical protein
VRNINTQVPGTFLAPFIPGRTPHDRKTLVRPYVRDRAFRMISAENGLP